MSILKSNIPQNVSSMKVLGGMSVERQLESGGYLAETWQVFLESFKISNVVTCQRKSFP